MEKGTYVEADITVKAKAKIRLGDGETVAQFKNRFADVYLHGAGHGGYIEKIDLGGDTTIEVGSVTKVD